MNIFNKHFDKLLGVKMGKEMADLINISDKKYKECEKIINNRIKEYQKVVSTINIDPAKVKMLRFYEKQIIRMDELYADLETINKTFLFLKEKNYNQKKMFEIIKNWSEYIFSFSLCLDYLLEDKSDISQYEKIDKEKIKMRKIKEWFNVLSQQQ